ncbi:MAG: trypsin-like peptidase domain-containing protein [Planctomycetota bacterium]
MPATTPAQALAQSDDDGLTPAQRERLTPVVRVVRDVGPAVVSVYQDVLEEIPAPWNQLMGSHKRRSSLGSGVIIDEEGYILTNAHVIALGNEGIRVRLSDRSEQSYPATLIRTDIENDIALLQIRPDPERPLVKARLGTSSDIMVGETVIAIGNPLSQENSVATGVVSSLFREVQVPTPGLNSQLTPSFKDFIQIDVPINRGNSGGPLFNVRGEVIGLNWAIRGDAQGIGFAIPIDRVRQSLIQNLLNPRLQREVVTGFETTTTYPEGEVTLASVEPEGPAAQAGLRSGDTLVELLGLPVSWEFDVNKALLRARPGDSVPVTVRRGTRTLRVDLTLAKDESPMLTIWRSMGVQVVDHPQFKGVRLERVDPGGPGALLGLRIGDIIDGIGSRTVDSTEELFALIRDVPKGTRVAVHVWRGNGASVGLLTLR